MSPQQPHGHVVATGPWRDGRHLVLEHDQRLPPVCLLTGVPTDHYEAHTIDVVPRLVTWTSMALQFEGFYDWANQPADLELPLCADVEGTRRTRIRRARYSIAVGVAGLGLFLWSDLPPWMLLVFLAAILSICHGACRLVRPIALPIGVRRRGSRIWLTGVHPAARASLPTWRQGRAALRTAQLETRRETQPGSPLRAERHA